MCVDTDPHTYTTTSKRRRVTSVGAQILNGIDSTLRTVPPIALQPMCQPLGENACPKQRQSKTRSHIIEPARAPDSANPPKRYRKSSEAEDPETAPLPAAGTDTMPADQRGDGPGSARVAAGVRSVHRPVARSSMKRSLRLPARGGQGRGHASFAARRLPSPLAAPSSSDPPKT